MPRRAWTSRDCQISWNSTYSKEISFQGSIVNMIYFL